MQKKKEDLMDKIVSLCKRRGFVYPGSEIYGGMANSWDYGPLGTALKNNIKQNWWEFFVEKRSDMYGLDAALIMNPKVWRASGHLENFSDPLIECKKCHARFRADSLIISNQKIVPLQEELLRLIQKYFDSNLSECEQKANQIDCVVNGFKNDLEETKYSGREKDLIYKCFKKAAEEAFELINYDVGINEDGYYEGGWDFMEQFRKRFSLEGLCAMAQEIYLDREIKCPNCNERDWGELHQFNLMFKTFIGSAEDNADIAYFRPETAQAMFVNFKNILDSFSPKLPFGMAQIGKAFRNEITPGNFIFRTREFEQMEIEYFIKPTDDWNEIFEKWLSSMKEWMESVGIDMEKVFDYEVPKNDLAHYSKRTIDIEFEFPFAKEELFGLAYRTDFDLKKHQEASGQSLEYFDEETKERYIPHVIEPSLGVDRALLAILSSAYKEEEIKDGEKRVYLNLNIKMAPFKLAVFPLMANKPELVKKAKEIYSSLMSVSPFIGPIAFDGGGNVGKRYRKQDEIGTPYCLTVDFQTLEDDTVTVRNRNTMNQERIKVEEVENFLRNNLK